MVSSNKWFPIVKRFNEMLNWKQIIYNQINNLRQFNWLNASTICRANAQQQDFSWLKMEYVECIACDSVVAQSNIHPFIIHLPNFLLEMLTQSVFIHYIDICLFVCLLCGCFSSKRTAANQYKWLWALLLLLRNEPCELCFFSHRRLFIYLSLPPDAFSLQFH